MSQTNNQHLRKIMQFFIAFTCGLACLLAVSTAALPTEEQIKEKAELVKKCITESGVDVEVLHSTGKGEAVNDEKLHCFGACMMQNMGVMNEAGEINKEMAIARIPDRVPRDEAIKVIEACANEKGDNPCATAGLVFKCLHEKKAADLFHP